MSARAAAWLAAIAALAGCATVPPPPLAEDPRWTDAMRAGHLPSRGSVYVAAPRLEQPADLELAEAAPVTVDDAGRATLWPRELPAEFLEETRRLLKENTGYDMLLWDAANEDAQASADYELEITIRRYRLDLVDARMASGMAALFPFGMFHLASFYNAPDEDYRCELEAEVVLQDRRRRREAARATIRGVTVQALTDFQRGWSFASYWPQQRASWLSFDDPVAAWQAYGERVIANCEPHARRGLLIDLVRFLREETPTAPAGPGTFALVVGVDRPPSAASAAADARAIAAWLRAPAPERKDDGAPRAADAVELLIGEAATADEVQRRLWALSGRVGPGDRLVVYFAGCGGPALPAGAPAADAPPAPLPTLQFADRLCAIDGLLEPLRAAGRRGAHPVAILDAGLFGGQRSVARPASARPARLEVELGGVHLWLAGGLANTGAREDPASGGAFTSALLTLLRQGVEPDAPLPSLEALDRQVTEALGRGVAHQRPALLGPPSPAVTLLPRRDGKPDGVD